MMAEERKIYFAGAIRGGRDDAELYLSIVQQLEKFGTVLTEHIGSLTLTSSGEDASDEWIHDRDLEWLADSDSLVAEVTTPSLGVGFEIAKATEWGKPVLCLFRPSCGRKLSALIAGSKSVMVRTYEHVSELEEIFQEFFAAK
jgi:2'-deoxynucleoside 5'-phosphate N-hydrolase